MKILFVDDHEVFVSMISGAFLRGHDVVKAATLEDARNALQNNNAFDIVLLDFDLPDGKGEELVQELLARQEKPIVIAFSSHNDGNNRLMAAGAHVLVGKMKANRLPEILSSS